MCGNIIGTSFEHNKRIILGFHAITCSLRMYIRTYVRTHVLSMQEPYTSSEQCYFSLSLVNRKENANIYFAE